MMIWTSCATYVLVFAFEFPWLSLSGISLDDPAHFWFIASFTFTFRIRFKLAGLY